MQGDNATVDNAWRGSQYCAVYERLAVSLDSGIRNVAPGTEAAVAKALVYFRMTRDEIAVGRLEAITMTILGLRRSLAGATGKDWKFRAELSRQMQIWLAGAPMFPAADARALDRVAA